MAAKKNTDVFNEMKATADSLMGKLEEEGKEVRGAARSFRSIVLKTLALHMRMIVWLYQYVRFMQEEQRQLDEESSLEAMNSTLAAAIDGGVRLLPMETGTGAREIKPAPQTSATLQREKSGHDNGDLRSQQQTLAGAPAVAR